MLIYQQRGTDNNQTDYSGKQIGIFKRKIAYSKKPYTLAIFSDIYPVRIESNRYFSVFYLKHRYYGVIIVYRIAALNHPPLSTYPKNKTKMVDMKVTPKNPNGFLDDWDPPIISPLFGNVSETTIVTNKTYYCKLGSLPRNFTKRFR